MEPLLAVVWATEVGAALALEEAVVLVQEQDTALGVEWPWEEAISAPEVEEASEEE